LRHGQGFQPIDEVLQSLRAVRPKRFLGRICRSRSWSSRRSGTTADIDDRCVGISRLNWVLDVVSHSGCSAKLKYFVKFSAVMTLFTDFVKKKESPALASISKEHAID